MSLKKIFRQCSSWGRGKSIHRRYDIKFRKELPSINISSMKFHSYLVCKGSFSKRLQKDESLRIFVLNSVYFFIVGNQNNKRERNTRGESNPF